MHFQKQPTTIDEQIEKLRKHGMTFECELYARRCLEAIGYYRLSAYWLPYEHPAENGKTRSKTFGKTVCFEDIHAIYVFDRQLRALVLEGIERVEIHLRARWMDRMVIDHGPHAHLNNTLFDNPVLHAKLLQKTARNVDQSNEVFIRHYTAKYTAPITPPLWAVVELMSFGDLSKWYSNTKDRSIQKLVAKDLGFPTRETADGAVQCLSYIRNICAHHGRLWNRRLVKTLPKVKRFRADWHFVRLADQEKPDDRLFNVLALLAILVRHQNTETTFVARMIALLDPCPPAQLAAMGFPPDWKDRPAWRVGAS